MQRYEKNLYDCQIFFLFYILCDNFYNTFSFLYKQKSLILFVFLCFKKWNL